MYELKNNEIMKDVDDENNLLVIIHFIKENVKRLFI